MGFTLAPEALAQGYRVESHREVASTNALALERAQAGVPGNLWICAESQTAGRGRRGREWVSPPGNLSATLLMIGDFTPPEAATLGFVSGLSLSDALDEVLSDLATVSVAIDAGTDSRSNRFTLKWPNDVLADGAKLSGILLESTILTDGRFAVAIGIGVNVEAHPDNPAFKSTSLRAMGAQISAGELFNSLSAAWGKNVAQWDEGRGLPVIRDRWLSRAAGLGGEVAVRLDGEIVRGTFDTIDEECRFVIRLEDGRLTHIAAGDVHFGAVASAAAS